MAYGDRLNLDFRKVNVYVRHFHPQSGESTGIRCFAPEDPQAMTSSQRCPVKWAKGVLAAG